MKTKNLNILWILLAAAVVAAGWLLPGFVLHHVRAPVFSMDYGEMEISAGDSSGYSWRLRALAQKLYPQSDGGNFEVIYITDRYSEEEKGDILSRTQNELQILSETNILSSSILDCVRSNSPDITISYLFDLESMRGLSYAEIEFQVNDGYIYFLTDISSGKIFLIGEFSLQDSASFSNRSSDEQQTFLRSFADYLELGENLDSEPDTQTPYDDAFSAATLTVETPDANGWLELRLLRYSTDYWILSVYRGSSLVS